MTIHEKAILAEKTARAAGEMLLHHGSFKVRRKSENDFVTEMDVKCEALIRDMLLSACPEDQFYGEETGGAEAAPGRWIVDPIDGTTNFMRGHFLYTISIAYEHDGALQIGCVYCPGADELFLAEKGRGAALNGTPIHVAPTPLRDAIVNMGFGHRVSENRTRTLAAFPALLNSVCDVRRIGTAAYEICSVAAGRADAFLELGLCLYDFAAAIVILAEAGGRVSGWAAGEDALVTGNLLATNGVIHDALRDILSGRANA